MNTPNVDAGRLERRVRRVGRDTVSGIHGFCSLFPFGAIRGVPLLRLTALEMLGGVSPHPTAFVQLNKMGIYTEIIRI